MILLPKELLLILLPKQVSIGYEVPILLVIECTISNFADNTKFPTSVTLWFYEITDVRTSILKSNYKFWVMFKDVSSKILQEYWVYWLHIISWKFIQPLFFHFCIWFICCECLFRNERTVIITVATNLSDKRKMFIIILKFSEKNFNSEKYGQEFSLLKKFRISREVSDSTDATSHTIC